MSDITFDTDSANAPYKRVVNAKPPAFVRLVLASGIVKDEHSANAILVSFAGVCGVAAVATFMFSSKPPQTPVPPSYTAIAFPPHLP